MAHQRAQSIGEGLGFNKAPHTVSLKVLRLSRPSLAHQYPLPNSHELGISPKASLAYPADNATTSKFIISPVLNLPEAFGSAYVGETLSCTLCANNELNSTDTTRTISGVKIRADMQTPSTPAGATLELAGAEGQDEADTSPGAGESLQKILRFELKEEGNHVLAVTVTYTETVLAGEGKAASGKVRTFRKLYQFVALQLLSVRTKAGELGKKDGLARYLLEAQLENMGEGAVSFEASNTIPDVASELGAYGDSGCYSNAPEHPLFGQQTDTRQSVNVNPKPPFKATSLNWDVDSPGAGPLNAPILKPRDVIQVAFLLEEQADGDEASDITGKLPPGDTRRILGQLALQWRSALGDRGSLSTGWLTSRR